MVKVDTFCEFDEFAKAQNVYTQKFYGNKHIHTLGGVTYVDYTALLHRREFYTKIWLRSHDNYFIITELISSYKLGKILYKFYPEKSLAGWRQWLYDELFSLAYQDRSLLHYEVPNFLWAFYRITSFIIRRSQR